eukprot:sb/3467969/
MVGLKYSTPQGFILLFKERLSKSIGRVEYRNVVQQRYFNNTGITTLFSTTDLEIVALALDWTTDAIYIAAYTTTTKKSSISVIMDRDSVLPVVHAAVDRIVSLVLDPRDRLMFWTDIQGVLPGQVARSYMDGGDVTVLADDVGRANGITLDYARRMIVWIDAGLGDTGRGTLQEMTYTGTNRRVDLILRDGWDCVARTYEAVCPTCPKDSPCVRVSGSKYDCVTKNTTPKATPGSANKQHGDKITHRSAYRQRGLLRMIQYLGRVTRRKVLSDTFDM